jgi:acyl-homoserine-lactone acylase
LEQEGCTNVVRFSDQFNSSALPANTRSKLLSSATGLTQDGYWVNHGTSFMLVVDFGTKPPRAEALLAYGESSDPRSPHFRDQLELFWQKQLRPVAFSDAEIQADPELTVACVSRSTERKIGTSCP